MIIEPNIPISMATQKNPQGSLRTSNMMITSGFWLIPKAKVFDKE